MTQITENFWLEELTHTDTGLDNTPGPEAVVNLTYLCQKILQPIRTLINSPVNVHVGFRSEAVNNKVGGVKDSQHLLGLAADIDAMPALGLQALFNLIRSSTIPYDQVIQESGCVHVSYAGFATTPRHEALVRTGSAPNWSYNVVH